MDGNKRTAITTTGLFIMRNGYTLIVEEEEMVRFTLGCAQSKVTLDEILKWLKQHCHSQ